MMPLVLLPGMMCDARLFGAQVEVLSETRDVQVMGLYGDTVAEIAAHILDNTPDRFALAGLSMGGIVAMEVLRQAPDRVAGLALLDTNPLAEADHIKERREPQITKVRQGRLEAVMRDEMKPFYLTDGPEHDRILDLCMDMAMALGADAFVSQSRALQSRPDQSETLSASHVPTLILCGRDDRLCPVSRHTLMKDLMPHATLHIVENAGHLPTLEQPKETTDALIRWLDST